MQALVFFCRFYCTAHELRQLTAPQVCIKWDDFGVKIGGWDWPPWPPGIIGPGPPPPIEFPPGVELKGILPPWPKIT